MTRKIDDARQTWLWAILPLCPVIGNCLITVVIAAQPTSNLTLRSSSTFLEESFAWAKNKAQSYVRTGQRPDYIPCYFAAMSDREFCVRDVAHHMEGAHLLGLDRENWSMMHLFAQGANRRVAQDYYWPRWHYPYTGKVEEDRSCQWRTLPAPFDMAWRCYEQYLWTGDDRWINDPEMFTYYTTLHTKFMEHQNWDSNGVADELVQLASYFEFPDAGEKLIEAGDAIGCQYQALLAYSNILKRRGETAGAQAYRAKANHLRAHFETHWFDAATGRYIRGFDRFTAFRSDWGHENSYFMPMTLITDQGPRTAAYLDFIEESIAREPLNIEATTYLPEVFYKHGRNETGWKYLSQVMKSRHSYPEVSFTCVGNTVSGLMGVRPSAPDKAVATLPRLPKEITWVEVDHVPIGANDLLVRHDGNRKTTVRNNKGPAITWRACFSGNFRQLRLGKAMQPAEVTTLNGKTIASVTVTVGPGDVVTVEAHGTLGADLPPPPSPRLEAETPPAAPSPGTSYLSDMKWRYGASAGGRPIKLDADHEGKPITIGGIIYPKGISVYETTAIRYDLHRQYARLLCDIGLADRAEGHGSVEFVIYGGGKTSSLLYSSGIIHAGAAGVRHLNLDVSSCDYVVLGVKDEGDGGGNRACWAGARVRTRGGTSNTQPPSAPEGLQAPRVDHSSAVLQWKASTDNVAVAGYDVYSGTLQVGSTKATTYQVAGLNPNSDYTFTVRAWDADGNTSAASRSLAVSTPLPPDLVYLSQLRWVSATTGFGSVGKDRSVDGKPIRLGGTAYARGLGTHASSEIVYDLSKLGKTYARFVSDVGIDNEISQGGSVVFYVYADDKKLFDSGVMTAASAVKTVDVRIDSAKQLRLVATDGGDGINSDHADWAGARLVGSGSR